MHHHSSRLIQHQILFVSVWDAMRYIVSHHTVAGGRRPSNTGTTGFRARELKYCQLELSCHRRWLADVDRSFFWGKSFRPSMILLEKLHQFVAHALNWLCQCQSEAIHQSCEVINICEFPMELGGLNLQGALDQKGTTAFEHGKVCPRLTQLNQLESALWLCSFPKDVT